MVANYVTRCELISLNVSKMLRVTYFSARVGSTSTNPSQDDERTCANDVFLFSV